ncbi:hypothetical protein SESBI_13543 [Sesbania bispinosa]|nr:hypothetical protein SESBI_13543 [Sesbania bispinosa]
MKERCSPLSNTLHRYARDLVVQPPKSSQPRSGSHLPSRQNGTVSPLHRKSGSEIWLKDGWMEVLQRRYLVGQEKIMAL